MITLERPCLPGLERQVAVVTGAAGGIGRAITHEFLRQGAIVVATDVSPIPEPSIPLSGYRFHRVEGDITEKHTLNAVLHAADVEGGASTLVNLLVHLDNNELPNPTQAEFDEQCQLANTLSRGCANQMQERGILGSIVNITSADSHPQSQFSAAPLTRLNQAIAKKYGQSGIRSNVIELGAIYTGTAQPVMPELESGNHARHTVLRRKGTSEEVIGAVAFLASSWSSYITGSTVTIDGGLTLR